MVSYVFSIFIGAQNELLNTGGGYDFVRELHVAREPTRLS